MGFLNKKISNGVAILFMLTTLITSCSLVIEPKVETVDPELQGYVNEYYTLLGQYCPNKKYNITKHYHIYLTKNVGYEADTIGMCSRLILGFDVQINRAFWNKASLIDRRQLIYHELAHCLIFKPHVNDKFNYMYPYQLEISPDELMYQVVQDIESYCGK